MRRRLFIGAIVISCHCALSSATPPVVLTRDTKTMLDLTETDLIRKKEMLDCELRLEGNPPNYKLVYSLGEIPVPEKAVKKASEQHRFIAVRASIRGLPVTGLWIHYHSHYPQVVSCQKGNDKCIAPVAYEMVLKQSEQRAFRRLSSIYPRELVFSGASDPDSDVNPGAIMITDRPKLISPAMDGHSGSKDKRFTNLYYACGTSINYSE